MAVELIGSAKDQTFTIPIEKFGPPGTRGELHFLAQFPGDGRSDASRMNDTSERHFKLFGLLSKTPLPADNISASLTENDGNSYLLKPASAVEIRVDTPWGKFAVKANAIDELSLVEFECVAVSVGGARRRFYQAVLPFLDHAAYLTHTPVVISSIRIEDTKNHITTPLYTSPFRKQIVGSADLLFVEMSPIYAMYREALNSNSDFYKFLCYYKILEGLLGTLRANTMKRAKSLGLRIEGARQLVPNCPDLPPALRAYVGRPVKAFFDKLLTPRYRNAVAHFMTDEGGILHLGDPDRINEYASLIPLCELSAREVIAGHEAILRSIAQGT